MKIPENLPWQWDGPVWDYDADNEAPWIISRKGVSILTGEISCKSRDNAEYLVTAANMLPEFIEALEEVSEYCWGTEGMMEKIEDLLNRIKT